MVNRLRRLTGAHRVGHAGTLDPLATGVLPVLFESATRLAEFALKLPKTYVADIHLGFVTATDDAEGEPEAVADPAAISAADVDAALAFFAGRILQQPPAFSAVKVGGRRAYTLARSGEPARLAPREVEVYSAQLLDFQPGPHAVARIEVRCGSGTYLRSIARDLGDRLAVGGYLGKLVRKAYGPLSIDEAVPLDELATPRAVLDRLLPAEVILPEMERVRLNVEQEAQVRQGRAVRVVPDPGPGLVRAHDADGRLVALGHADPLRRTFVPEKVLS
ncbi:MAG: tRNA pseudouridine(55) synthase TruB [Chloroflexi bacterium]|nr:MAG: tRNA pseudouridine(55) synthase TruB [Chloroflexota bacterium]TMF78841.1 MAG: tRNA pseudouridine(55) synthase TruB [Chloroflexota bacterium]TMF92416.1 MAG: tRNA pseudouridine(55) synthase TruB [Chloroflexota bacterium]TMG44853.1 MAG: tRNA pseudouridine(55) synthase TruB [Chloroflexota bacterium]